MKNRLVLFCTVFAGLFPVLSLAQKALPTVAKAPVWVLATETDFTHTSLDDEADEGYIDLFREKQVNVDQQTTYYRCAYKIISESGLQNRSTISVSFDPAYSNLSFHSLLIRRGKKTIDKLQPVRFKMIQQENELSRYLYNGSISAVMFLDDVRKGDIIEYSYSISGFNPVFNGKYADVLEANLDVPVYQLHYRIIMPAGRTLRFRNWQTDVECRRSKLGKDSVFEWTLNQVPALHPESELPDWYNPYSSVMVSEFRSWNEVSRWAAGLFPDRYSLTPAMKNRISSVKKKYSSNSARFLALLRFVQDDVRYLGVEMGENSYRPNEPSKVFDQRFGDCKDKAYLLLALCKAAGIPAKPVLVNSTEKQNLHQWIPSSLAFDHVVVRVEINGLFYWFDPTIAYQRGTIDDIDFPNYGCGLVVSDTSRKLTDFPDRSHGLVDIREHLAIYSDGNARLTVQSEYSGGFADNLRSDLHSSSLYSIRRRYQEFYNAYVDDLTIDSFSWREDEKTGRLVTSESYTISNYWDPSDTGGMLQLSPFVINSVLHRPHEQQRNMPFALNYPAHYREELSVDMPEEWVVKPVSVNISCNEFLLKSRSSYTPRRLNLRYEYQALSDHLPPEDTDEYLVNLQKADAGLNYVLSTRAPDTTTVAIRPLPVVNHSSDKRMPSWIFPAFTIMMAGFFFWLGKRQKRIPLAASQRGRVVNMKEYADDEEQTGEDDFQ